MSKKTKRYMVNLMIILTVGHLSACPDTIAPRTQGCESLASSCPERTECQLDALGNAFCAPLMDPPLANAGTETAGTEMAGTEMIGGEIAGSEIIGGDIAGEEITGTEAGLMAGMDLAGMVMAGSDVGGTDVGGTSMAGAEDFMCGSFMTNLKPSEGSIPEVMLVVDRSSSMNNSEDRWTPALRAISQVTQALEENVSFGLTLFPDPSNTNADAALLNTCMEWGRDQFSCEEDLMACTPGRVLVNQAINNSFNIRQALNSYPPVPNQGTPTYSALQEAARALTSQGNQSSEKIIILVTDGLPGCNFEIDPQECTCLTSASFQCEFGNFAGMCLDDNQTIQEVSRLAGLGIKTIVVGITIGSPEELSCIEGDQCRNGGQACINGSCVNLAPSVLSAMARAGGDPSGNYYNVENVADIESQVTLAAASVAPCIFDIQNIPESVYDQLVVYLDGTVVPRDEARMNGWWANRGILEFYGSACDTIRDGMSHRIAARCE